MNSVQVFIESRTTLILIIVGPNQRKEKICGNQTGQPKRREASPYLDAQSLVLVVPAWAGSPTGVLGCGFPESGERFASFSPFFSASNAAAGQSTMHPTPGK
jgi:hypothetical protein